MFPPDLAVQSFRMKPGHLLLPPCHFGLLIRMAFFWHPSFLFGRKMAQAVGKNSVTEAVAFFHVIFLAAAIGRDVQMRKEVGCEVVI